ncbi:MAG: DUF4296 domain-containing protein [Bacteroidales bacterium]|nr:DUF4296 domain-containing protein [Bacteroidales bacterium]
MISSCQNRPREVLNRKSMEQLMYDVYIAEATLENDYGSFNTPEKKEAYINKVFMAHKVTQAQWDTSLSWYSDRIDLYLKMNDSVKVRIQRARKDIDRNLERIRAEQVIDPALLSPSYIPSYYSFSIPGAKTGFHFRLDSAEISSRMPGDEFSFTFSVIGVPPLFTSDLSSMLTLVYGDTIISQSHDIRENKSYHMDASRFIPGDTLTQINGFVHLQDRSGNASSIQLHSIYLGENGTDSVEVSSPELSPAPQARDPFTVDTMMMVQ